MVLVFWGTLGVKMKSFSVFFANFLGLVGPRAFTHTTASLGRTFWYMNYSCAPLISLFESGLVG